MLIALMALNAVVLFTALFALGEVHKLRCKLNRLDAIVAQHLDMDPDYERAR